MVVKMIQLSECDCQYLLKLARNSIAERMLYNVQLIDDNPTEDIQEKSGVFVFLYENGNLRGSSGNILSDKTISENVIFHSIRAGFEDSRFISLQKNEFDFIQIQIYVITRILKLQIEDIDTQIDEMDGAVILNNGKIVDIEFDVLKLPGFMDKWKTNNNPSTSMIGFQIQRILERASKRSWESIENSTLFDSQNT